jgi:hypothetical protein
MSAARVDKASWTFDLAGECVYCGKKCTRSRTFIARTADDAAAQADAAMAGLCHRKCGGY